MTPERFQALIDEGYNRIPVYREVLADLDTPVSAYLKLVGSAPFGYLLESVQGGESWARYSMIGLPARTVIRIVGNEIEMLRDGETLERVSHDDPLAWVQSLQARFRSPKLPELPKFTGGLVGYFGYETIGYIEKRLSEVTHEDPIAVPDILLLLSEEVAVFDNLNGKLFLIIQADPAEREAYPRALERLDYLVSQLRRCVEFPSTQSESAPESDEARFSSGFPREPFMAAVERAKRYIVDGDVMQVVLSQRLSTPFAESPINLYRALRQLNPSPYLYFMDLGEFQIVGSSPEILVRLEEGEVTVRPIAGTRPRGSDAESDKALEEELLADPKEVAEHLMLIDLGRNDVGRVAQIGTVKLDEQMVIERYSHVMHIVSNVTGQLKAGLDAIDVLRATFPAGTLSGAPKIRAMEIIAELEPVKRGVYAGAVGYLGWCGNMDTAIAIRTAVIKGGQLHVQAGAGIVYDSVPELEWEESMNKARAMMRAVALTKSGLE